MDSKTRDDRNSGSRNCSTARESFSMPLLIGYKEHQIDGIDAPFVFPWWFDWLEERAQKNHSQTLSRLRERGGLSYCEALAVLEDRRWRGMTVAEIQEGFRRHQFMVKEGIGPEDFQTDSP